MSDWANTADQQDEGFYLAPACDDPDALTVPHTYISHCYRTKACIVNTSGLLPGNYTLCTHAIKSEEYNNIFISIVDTPTVTTTTTTTTTTQAEESSDDLSTGAIVGIAVGSGLAFVLLVVFIVYMVRRSNTGYQQVPW